MPGWYQTEEVQEFRALGEFAYDRLENALIVQATASSVQTGIVKCRERLGGTLSHYFPHAA